MDARSSFHTGLAQTHRHWLEVFGAELDWWQEHLASAENREALGISDNEPFRPAYDRARWALPGTIATGFAHTANVRDMGRVIAQAKALALNVLDAGGGSVPASLWAETEKAYDRALPAFQGYALRTAITDVKEEGRAYRLVPGHLLHWHRSPEVELLVRDLDASDLDAICSVDNLADSIVPFGEGDAYKRGGVGYLDPTHNRTRALVAIRCSLAVARDWHRHRTLFPWTLRPLNAASQSAVLGPSKSVTINRAYEPKSAFAKERVPALLQRATHLYRGLVEGGDHYRALLALPLGTDALLYGYGGLRDVLYMLELRSKAHGTNFEYRNQALQMLEQLRAVVSLESL